MKKITAIGSVALGAVTLLGVLALGSASRAQSRDGGTPWLGVYTQSLDGDLREGIGYNGAGVLITRVVDGSPADRAGLRKGDVITRVGARSIESASELTNVIGGQSIGARVKVRVVRDRSNRDFDVVLTARPEGGDGDRRVIRLRDRDSSRARREIRIRARDDAGEPGNNENNGDENFDFHFDLKDLDQLKDLEGLDGMHDFHVLPDGNGLMMMGMSRGRLGVRIESLNAQLGEYFQAPDGKGVLVLEVLDDTPASKAGIKAGDVITRVGSNDVADADDLIQALRGEDGKVSITVLRHGSQRTIEAELERSEAPTARRWSSRDDAPQAPQAPRAPRAPRVEVYRGNDSDMRKELEDLRRELRELKEELKSRE